MLPLYDAELDPQIHNIFLPLETVLPYDLPKLVAIATTDSSPVKANSTASSPFKKSEIDTYCKTCKKKFSNEPTFTNHLKSAKHIANEKKFGFATTRTKPTDQRIAVNPQVQAALIQLEQAQDPSTNPATAVTIFWNQAQLLYGLKRPQYVEKTLSSLINLLSSGATTTFSSAQITSFLYNSRLALARLLCLYQAVDESRSVYLDALEGKWKLEKNELLDIAKNLSSLSIPSLLNSCDKLATRYLTRERNRTKPAPLIADPNNSITTILNEAGNLFAQQSETINKIPVECVAIVLYATCSLACPYEKAQGLIAQSFYFMMSQIYDSLGNFTHRIIEIKLLDQANSWEIFNALLLSLEIDDLVRAKHIRSLLNDSETYLYPDVKLVCDICQSKLTLNNDNLQQDFDYLKLILEETKEPSLMKERAQTERTYLLDRISMLL